MSRAGKEATARLSAAPVFSPPQRKSPPTAREPSSTQLIETHFEDTDAFFAAALEAFQADTYLPVGTEHLAPSA